MSHVCKITRVKDGYYQHTGYGSFEGCLGEAKVIKKRLARRGEEFNNPKLGVYESDWTKVEVLEHAGLPPRITYDPTPFLTPRRLLQSVTSTP